MANNNYYIKKFEAKQTFWAFVFGMFLGFAMGLILTVSFNILLKK